MAKSLYFLDHTYTLRKFNGSAWSSLVTLPDTPSYYQRWLVSWRGRLIACVASSANCRMRQWDGTTLSDYSQGVTSQVGYNSDGVMSEPVIYRGHLVWLIQPISTAARIHEWDGTASVGGGDDTVPTLPVTIVGASTNGRDYLASPYWRLVPFADRLLAFSSAVSGYHVPNSTNGCASSGFVLVDMKGPQIAASFKQSALGPELANAAGFNYTTRYQTVAANIANMDTTPVGFFTLANKLYYISITGMIKQVDPVTGVSTQKYDLKTGTTGNPLYCGTLALVTATVVTKISSVYNTALANRQRFLTGGKLVPTSGAYSGVELLIHNTAGNVTPDTVSVWCTSRADNSYVPLMSAINADVWMGLGAGASTDGNNSNVGRSDSISMSGPQVLGVEYSGYAYIVVMGQHTNSNAAYPGGLPSFIIKYDGTNTPTIQRFYVNTNQDPDSIGSAIMLDDEAGLVHVVYRDGVLQQIRHLTFDTSLTVTDVGSIMGVPAPDATYIMHNMVLPGSLCMWDSLAPAAEVIAATIDAPNTAVDVVYDIATSDGAVVTAVVEYCKGPGQAWSTATRKTGHGEALTSVSTAPTTINYPLTTNPGVGTLVNGANFTFGYLNLSNDSASRLYAAYRTPALGVSGLVGLHVTLDAYYGSYSYIFNSFGWSFNIGDPTQVAAGATVGWAIPGSGVISVGFARRDDLAPTAAYIPVAKVADVTLPMSTLRIDYANPYGPGLTGATWYTWDIWISFLDAGIRIRVSIGGHLFEVYFPTVMTPLSTWTTALFGACGTGSGESQSFKNLVVRPAHRFSHDAGTDLPSYFGPLQYRVRGTR